MKTLIPCLLLALCACGKGIGPQVIDPEIAPYVEKFQAAAAKYGKTIVVGSNLQFGDPGKGRAGYCIMGNITIDRTFWDNHRESERELVVAHELGHCELGRGHDDKIVEESHENCIYDTPSSCHKAIFSSTYAESIMNSELANIQFYGNEERYYKELFK